MIKLTTTEIAWIIGELDKNAAINTNAAALPKVSTIEKGLLNLKAENLTSMSNKLQKALDNDDKCLTGSQGPAKTYHRAAVTFKPCPATVNGIKRVSGGNKKPSAQDKQRRYNCACTVSRPDTSQ